MNYLVFCLSRDMVKVPGSPFPVADIREVLLQTPIISAENPAAALLIAKERFPYLTTNLAVQDAQSYTPTRRDAPALILAQRILSGEAVPLADLISFLQTSVKSLHTENKLRDTTPKPTEKDIDFF